MRAIRLSLVGIVTVCLLAGMSVAVTGQSDTMEPGVTPISGTMRVVSEDDAGERTMLDGRLAYMGEEWTTMMDVDDPRLDGLGRSTHNRFTSPGAPFGPRSLTLYAENDGGSWVGTGHAYQDRFTTGLHYQNVMVGQGDYEGLIAIIALDQPMFGTSFDVSGAIISGGMPPMPEAAPTTFVQPASDG